MRFVVLHHFGWPGRQDHYDLMIEMNEGGGDDERALKAFATLSSRFPDGERGSGDAAHEEDLQGLVAGGSALRPLAEHRRAYLRLEGPLSGERGAVKRVDEGTLEWREPPDPDWRACAFRMEGRALKGEFRLLRVDDETYSFERLGPE
jgi:hypothetical protein